jgi:hypothetical protein
MQGKLYGWTDTIQQASEQGAAPDQLQLRLFARCYKLVLSAAGELEMLASKFLRVKTLLWH